jgi:hypothetical protein
VRVGRRSRVRRACADAVEDPDRLERKREDRSVQRAARLAFIDLYAVSLSISEAVGNNTIQPLNESGLERYLEHEPTLAAHLRIKDYLEVAAAVGELRLFVEQAERRRAVALSEPLTKRLTGINEGILESSKHLLEVARRGPAHMWPQRAFRGLYRRLPVAKEQQTIEEIRGLARDLARTQNALMRAAEGDERPE